MKKALTLFLTLILSLGVLVSCTHQEEITDSINLPKRIYSDLKMSSCGFVVKFYNDDTTILLDEYDIRCRFDESEYAQGLYFCQPLNINSLSQVKYYGEDEKLHDLTVPVSAKLYGEFFEYAINPEKILGYSARVENVYCFADQYAEWWIYYETKDGMDYILLKEHSTDEKLYLFTFEQLEPIVKSLKSEKEINSKNDGTVIISDVADISEYELHQERFLGVQFGALWLRLFRFVQRLL